MSYLAQTVFTTVVLLCLLQSEEDELREFELLEQAAVEISLSQTSLLSHSHHPHASTPPTTSPLSPQQQDPFTQAHLSQMNLHSSRTLPHQPHLPYDLVDEDAPISEDDNELDDTLRATPPPSLTPPPSSLATGIEFNDEEAWESFTKPSPERGLGSLDSNSPPHSRQDSVDGCEEQAPLVFRVSETNTNTWEHSTRANTDGGWYEDKVSTVSEPKLNPVTVLPSQHISDLTSDPYSPLSNYQHPPHSTEHTAIHHTPSVTTDHNPTVTIGHTSTHHAPSVTTEHTSTQHPPSIATVHTSTQHAPSIATEHASTQHAFTQHAPSVTIDLPIPPPSSLISKLFPALRKECISEPHTKPTAHSTVTNTPSPPHSVDGDSGKESSLSSTSLLLGDELRLKLCQLETEIERYKTENGRLERLRREREEVCV